MIKIGIIGAGSSASIGGLGRTHMLAYQTLSDVKVTAVADIEPNNGKPMAEEVGGEYYSDYKAMLEKADIDAVSICLPHSLHCDAALAAAANGKHVLVEKPISVTLDEADRMINGCRTNGVKLMVAFAHRFHEELMRAKEMIKAGKLGNIAMAVDYMGLGGYNTAPQWFWQRKLAGGGCLIFNGIHGIDRLIWLVGSGITEVYSRAGTYSHDADVEDHLVATLQFENGAIGSLINSFSAFTLPGRCDVDIYGVKGSIRIKAWDSMEFSSNDATFVQKRERDELWHKQAAEFINAIKEDREPSPSGEDGKASQAVALAMYESVERGKPVSIKEIMDNPSK